MIADFRAVLLGAAEGLVGTRVYPVSRPQASPLPCLVYQTVSDVPEYHLKSDSGLSRARVQVNAIAETYAEAEALVTALRGLSGAKPAQGNTDFRTIQFDGKRDLFDPAAESDITSRTYAVSLDFIIWHRSLQ